MTESILARVKRVVMGRVGDMVDAFETAQGENAMRKAVRDVERAIDDARGEVARQASKRKRVARQAMRIRANAAEFTEKARVALTENRPDFAEGLIARQFDLEAQVPGIENAIGEARAEETELAQCLSALQARKREMEADLAAFVAARRVSPSAVSKSASGFASGAWTGREAESKVAEFEQPPRPRAISERVHSLRVAS